MPLRMTEGDRTAYGLTISIAFVLCGRMMEGKMPQSELADKLVLRPHKKNLEAGFVMLSLTRFYIVTLSLAKGAWSS